MEVKLINGKWMAVFENTLEDYNSLNNFERKLFSCLLRCEFILFNLKVKEKSKVELFYLKISSFLEEFKILFEKKLDNISIRKFKKTINNFLQR